MLWYSTQYKYLMLYRRASNGKEEVWTCSTQKHFNSPVLLVSRWCGTLEVEGGCLLRIFVSCIRGGCCLHTDILLEFLCHPPVFSAWFIGVSCSLNSLFDTVCRQEV